MADAAPLAEAMAELTMTSDPLSEARALSHSELFHKIDGAERERIVELFNCRTTADIERCDELRETAQAWLEAAEAPLSRGYSPEESPAQPALQPAQTVS